LIGEGWLGVILTPIEGEDAAALGYDHIVIRVERVFPNSPAESSGFLANDIILQFDDTELTDVQQLVTLVRTSQPGRQVDFTILRDGESFLQPLLLGLRQELEFLQRDLFSGLQAPVLSANFLETDEALVLDEQSEEVIVLVFWATWCGPCRREIPSLNALHEQLNGRSVRIIGISEEEPEVVRAFLEETEMNYTLAYDLEDESNRRYWITAVPTVFLIDRTRIVREVFVGADHVDELRTAILDLLEE
jgi:peroxiredoxin